MEKQLYYRLEDNDGNSSVFESIGDLTHALYFDIGDVEPNDRVKLKYTLTPILLTEEEFSAIGN